MVHIQFFMYQGYERRKNCKSSCTDKKNPAKNKTVQIEILLSEYGGNKKAVRTDGLLAKHQN